MSGPQERVPKPQLNTLVEAYYEPDGGWYEARVVDFNHETGEHFIIYTSDDSTQWIWIRQKESSGGGSHGPC